MKTGIHSVIVPVPADRLDVTCPPLGRLVVATTEPLGSNDEDRLWVAIVDKHGCRIPVRTVFAALDALVKNQRKENQKSRAALVKKKARAR